MGSYTCQQIVDEQTKRVLNWDFPAAQNLKCGRTEFVMAREGLDASGGSRRLKRRRVGEAQMNLTNEFGLPNSTSTRVRKRIRTHNDSCAVM